VKLVIGYLYPSVMSQYGDRGNVITVLERCRRRGIETSVTPLEVGDTVGPDQVDLLLVGGGADTHQQLVWEDLVGVKGEGIRRAVEEGAAAFVVCAGYQLFGHYYRTARGQELPGIGVFDAHTVHRAAQTGTRLDSISEAGSVRAVGNLVVAWRPADSTSTGDPGPDLTPSSVATPATGGGDGQRPPGSRLLVGFENHGGRTYLRPGAQPLGRVLTGGGNNSEDGWEGCQQRNAIGTYLHGPALPKNPHLADHLIGAALRRRYGEVRLDPLDDGAELAAHDRAVERALSKPAWWRRWAPGQGVA
jgi:CobQ-like glutamine amidotransferase family enzyme